MIQIIEQHHDTGVDWLISFEGYNPTDENCVRCSNEKEAIKLQRLINDHIRVHYKKELDKDTP